MPNAEVLNIYWITDLHLNDHLTGKPEAEGSVYLERHYYAAMDKLKQTVDIANREGPDLLVCTGDMVDGEQSHASFMAEWSKVNGPKELMIGNHDLHNDYSSIVKELGYQDRPVIAGSPFNRSFPLHKGDTQARVLVLDAYVGSEGRHRTRSCVGTIEREAFEWLEREMFDCPEVTILLFAHNGLGGPEKYFRQEDVEQFIELTDRLHASQPRKSIIHLAGHHHVHPEAVIRKMSSSVTFVNGVASIVGPTSRINHLLIRSDGSFMIHYIDIGYPYRYGKVGDGK